MTEAPSTEETPRFKIPLEISAETLIGTVVCTFNDDTLTKLLPLYHEPEVLKVVLEGLRDLLSLAGESLSRVVDFAVEPSDVHLDVFIAPGYRIGNLVGDESGTPVTVLSYEVPSAETSTKPSSSEFPWATRLAAADDYGDLRDSVDNS